MLPVVFHPDYVVPLPAGHRFPMDKFRRIRDVLLHDRIISTEQIYTPSPATEQTISAVHSTSYIRDYLKGTLDTRAMRRIGLPWSHELVKRTCTALGGTLLSAELALSHGVACNTAGGTHHAFRDFGSGFCIFNDLAVTARHLLNSGRVRSVLIVDLDVHQGDGTAAILQTDPFVFTFSMHCDVNFPFTKQVSDLDISLAEGSGDEEYLQRLRYHLPSLLDSFDPDLVLYDAGVDPHESDRLGKLNLSDDGIYERDRFVIAACVDADVPIAAVVGGGYSDDLNELAYRHTLLHRAASVVFDAHMMGT